MFLLFILFLLTLSLYYITFNPLFLREFDTYIYYLCLCNFALFVCLVSHFYPVFSFVSSLFRSLFPGLAFLFSLSFLYLSFYFIPCFIDQFFPLLLYLGYFLGFLLCTFLSLWYTMYFAYFSYFAVHRVLYLLFLLCGIPCTLRTLQFEFATFTGCLLLCFLSPLPTNNLLFLLLLDFIYRSNTNFPFTFTSTAKIPV